ncbi:MAG: acyl-CoA dehydrogenase family protein [Sporichthyaceae bacterium]
MSQHTAALVPDEDERALATAVREVLADVATSERLRAGFDTAEGYDADGWKTLAGDVGLCGLTIPERWGGLGLGPGAVDVVHVELGHALYPGPFLAVSLAATALAASADEGAQERWLPGIAGGDLVATVACTPPGPGHPPLVAVATGKGWQLCGRVPFVPAAHVADLLLLTADTPAGPTLFAVPAGTSGVVVTAMTGLDLTRRLGDLVLSDVPALLVGAEGGSGAAQAAVARHLRIALAAEAAGGLQWCSATATAYAGTREQFGRLIGSYQAVAHAAVDIYSAARAARAGARWAAVAAANGDPEADLASHVAALRAGEAYRVQTEAGVHLLGGIGFTWEHDMHLYYRRARAAGALAGGAPQHRAAIAALAGL